MNTMLRTAFVSLPLFLGALAPAQAAVSVGIGINIPGVSIGLNVPAYPQMVRVPGYPVYYDPQSSDNYFFYDGLYWVYRDDTWYQSSWYNGPWQMSAPEVVPAYVLRVPVRYYRHPPVFFGGWASSRPPHWGEHWGRDWEQRRRGWDHWDRRERAEPAPLPAYQRDYHGERYPREPDQQHAIRAEKYGYQPREAVTRQSYEQHAPTPAKQEARRDNKEQEREKAKPQ